MMHLQERGISKELIFSYEINNEICINCLDPDSYPINDCILAFSHYKASLKETIARQQFLMISKLANGIDNRLLATQQDLISIAKATPPDIMANPEKAQTFFDNRPILHRIFDNHLSLFTPAGKIFVESPYVPGRRGLDLSFQEYNYKYP